MAILFPENFLFRTKGEKVLYDRILKQLSNDWIIFYEPIIQGRVPDFILFNDRVGIVIIEVKDYTIDTIHSFNPSTWKLNSNGEIIEVTAPLKQVINYRNTLHEFLTSFNEFIDIHSKRLSIPIHIMCAFPFLNEGDLDLLNLKPLFTNYSILVKDDLYNLEPFYKKINLLINHLFVPNKLSNKEVNKLLQVIYPYQKNPFKSINKKEKNKSKINFLKFNTKKLPSVITEVLYIADKVISEINTHNINFNEILIVTNKKRLGRYNADQYIEKLIEQLQFKQIPLHNYNGVKFISYEKLAKNQEILKKMKRVFWLILIQLRINFKT